MRHGLRVGSLEVLLKGKVSINVLLVLKGQMEAERDTSQDGTQYPRMCGEGGETECGLGLAVGGEGVLEDTSL